MRITGNSRTRRIVTAALTLLLAAALAAPGALAAKGGNGGGGGGKPGGGGGDPPADPAICYFKLKGASFRLNVMNADGSNQTTLFDDVSAGHSDAACSWSPDGSRIVFQSAHSGTRALYTINVDGTGLTWVTDVRNLHPEPAWSPVGPDGTEWIAFADHLGDGNRDIYLVRPDGTGRFNLTNLPNNAAWPTWSPDGTRLATGYQQAVWVHELDWSSGVPAVSSSADYSAGTVIEDRDGVRDLDWSNTDAVVAVRSSLAGYWTVYALDVGSLPGIAWPLPGTGSGNGDPTWSPADDEIAHSDDAGIIHAVRVSDGAVRDLTSRNCRAPDWKP